MDDTYLYYRYFIYYLMDITNIVQCITFTSWTSQASWISSVSSFIDNRLANSQFHGYPPLLSNSEGRSVVVRRIVRRLSVDSSFEGNYSRRIITPKGAYLVGLPMSDLMR